MRKGGGKAKGAEFERGVCKSLSLWLSAGNDEGLLWRSAMSGGRSTVAFAKGRTLGASAGDISAVGEGGMPLIRLFTIECKTYRTLDYHGLINRRGKLVEFWAEVRKQAKRYNKEPILIAKQNQQPIIVCLTAKGREVLDVKTLILVPYLNMRILLFEEFLKHAKVPT